MAMDALQDMPHVPKGLIFTYAVSEAAAGKGDVVLYAIFSELVLGFELVSIKVSIKRKSQDGLPVA